jgi:hypothetical protein
MQKYSTIFLMKTRILLLILAGAGLVIAALYGFNTPVSAAPASDSPKLTPQSTVCLTCHARPGFQTTLPSGEILVLTIASDHFDSSVHGNLSCTDCHTGIRGVPHPALTAQNRREVTLQFYTTCQQCHAEQYNATLDSVHQRALAAGNSNAAVCTDCHDPHTQTAITDQAGNLLPEARVKIPQTCARCHSAIFAQYQTSVHGSALIGEGNLDVPTCIDCHGVHNIGDPTTAAFRLASPQLCAGCHTNPKIMDKYGISTDVLSTYVADFHGTTVTLFESQSPDQAVNKPVCFDCHGIHDIQRPDNPVSGIAMKQNLLVVCQQCHPDATANFPDAWLSHYIPSPQHDALVYYVNLFYKFFIPGVLGPMAIFVISDIIRRWIDRRKGRQHA